MKRFTALKVDDSVAGHVDLELYFYTEVLKLKSLHYGYWTRGEEPTLGGLKEAQEAFTETLLEMIPGNVKKVLDVGCGMGDNARALVSRGFSVTAISPDAEHGKFVAGTKGVTFHRTRFENFENEGEFDLVLMSESQNYFDRDLGLQKCREVLDGKGYLLISGMFRKETTAEWDEINVESEFVAAARGVGLELLERIDITAQTTQTLELARNAYLDHVEPAGRLVGYYLDNTAPWKMRLLRFFFAKQFARLEEIRAFADRRLYPESFRQHANYVSLLFGTVDS